MVSEAQADMWYSNTLALLRNGKTAFYVIDAQHPYRRGLYNRRCGGDLILLMRKRRPGAGGVGRHCRPEVSVKASVAANTAVSVDGEVR